MKSFQRTAAAAAAPPAATALPAARPRSLSLSRPRPRSRSLGRSASASASASAPTTALTTTATTTTIHAATRSQSNHSQSSADARFKQQEWQQQQQQQRQQQQQQQQQRQQEPKPAATATAAAAATTRSPSQQHRRVRSAATTASANANTNTHTNTNSGSVRSTGSSYGSRTTATVSTVTATLNRPSLLVGLPVPGILSSLSSSSSLLYEGNHHMMAMANYSNSININNSNNGNSSNMPPRPRRLWRVQDTKLPHFPPLWPEPCRSDCVVLEDASPSVIAVRIAECLRRRSVATEFDEEAATATAMTVDRCHFIIQLWQVSKPLYNPTAKTTHSSPMPPPLRTNAVLVECVRQSGNVITFHRTVQAILAAAQGMDTGQDRRGPYRVAPTEYPRWPASSTSAQLPTSSTGAVPASATTISAPGWQSALERIDVALQWLRKDRLEPQLLGMEMVLAGTDPISVGRDAATAMAMAVLGQIPPRVASWSTSTKPSAAYQAAATALVRELHNDWMEMLIVQGRMPDDGRTGTTDSRAAPFTTNIHHYHHHHHGGGGVVEAALSSFSACAGGGGSGAHRQQLLNQQQDDGAGDGVAHRRRHVRHASESSRAMPSNNNNNNNNANAVNHSSWAADALGHVGTLRSFALRALVNSLSLLLLSTNGEGGAVTLSANKLRNITSWLQALGQDLQGARRPPGVLHGTALASPHEAAAAARCLALLWNWQQQQQQQQPQQEQQQLPRARSSSSSNNNDNNNNNIHKNSDDDPSDITADLAIALDKARKVGQITHEILAQEASWAYERWTEDVRSC